MRFFASMLFAGIALAAPPVEGNPKSPVRVLIYEDLQAPECAQFRLVLDSLLLAKYGNQVAFEHHDFPQDKHSWARRAAIAARYFDAHNPKLGLEFRRQALAGHEAITAEELTTWIITFARQFAVDPVKAVDALNNPSLAAKVDQDLADGMARGVVETPTVFINEQRVDMKSISEGIEAALAAAKKP